MFQLSTEICLRSLALLVSRREGLVQSVEIGDRLGISAAYVTKCLQPMARRGWLRSWKGRGGGWSLAVAPEAVSLAEVVLSLEPDHQWTRCVIGYKVCGDENPCPFHEGWKKAKADFLAAMNRLNLRDLEDYLPPPVQDPPKRAIRSRKPGSGRRSSRA